MSSTARIHFGYIVGILLAVIVGLITVEWGGIHDLVNYIGFALTITSLVLALLAIIYSYFSNATFGQNISTLNTASREMSQSAAVLTAATAALRERIDVIPGALETMGKQFEETRGAIATLAERGAAQFAPPSAGDATPKDAAHRFLTKSPLSGLLTLYSAARSVALARPMDLQYLGKRVRYMNSDYTFAFVVAADLACVLTRKDTAGKEQTLITWIAPLISENVRDRLFTVASQLDNSMKLSNTTKFSDEIGPLLEAIDAIMEGRDTENKSVGVEASKA